MPAHQRIPALDGLRGVASLMVLFYHLGPLLAEGKTDHFEERFLQFGHRFKYY